MPGDLDEKVDAVGENEAAVMDANEEEEEIFEMDMTPWVEVKAKYDESTLSQQQSSVAEDISSVIESPEDLLGKKLSNSLKRSPLINNLGPKTFEAILKASRFVTIPERGEIISPESENQGLYIPTQPMRVGIYSPASSPDEEDVEVKVIDLHTHLYLGQYVMAGVKKPTAKTVNLSPETQMVFIPKEVFPTLHPSSRQAMLKDFMRNAPLQEQEEEIDQDPLMENVLFAICEARPLVPTILKNLELRAGPDKEKSNYTQNYRRGQIIEPNDTGYLALIVDGKVDVNLISVPENVKIAEIREGNTLFEVNAAGVVPPINIQVFSGSDDCKILWIFLSEDDPNYESYLKAANEGLADKVGKANLRKGALKKWTANFFV